jgi:ssDNA thymidine ADP-ribosyltransferase, DarT
MSPDNARLFHITAIQNLPLIVAAGALQAKNTVSMRNVRYTNIAHQSIQEKRATKAVNLGRGGVIHDYVPFYFAPRSPMLLTVHFGQAPGYSGGQEGIATLETTVIRATALDPGGFVFYDMNASLAYSKAYDDLSHLNAVAWDLLTEPPTLDGFCQYWQSKPESERYAKRMEKRQAEFLVHQRVPLSAITQVGVCNAKALSVAQKALTGSPLEGLLSVRPDWYYQSYGTNF